LDEQKKTEVSVLEQKYLVEVTKTLVSSLTHEEFITIIEIFEKVRKRLD